MVTEPSGFSSAQASEESGPSRPAPYTARARPTPRLTASVDSALALALAASYLGRRALNMVGRFMTSGFWPVGVVSPSL